MSMDALLAASADALAVFAANGVGIVEGGSDIARPPEAVMEVRAVPAFAAILAVLDEHALGIGAKSPSSAALARAELAPTSEQQEYVAKLGVCVLVWLRHVDAHAYLATRIIEHSGLTAAVIAEAVEGAALALERKDAAFRWSDGRLTFHRPRRHNE